MTLRTPRDRHGTFEPQLVEKYVRRLPGFDDMVIRQLAHDQTTRGIRDTLQEHAAWRCHPS